MGQLIYGEMTMSPLPVDAAYQFYIIDPTSESTCRLKIENYLEARALLKKIATRLFVRKLFGKNTQQAIDNLHRFVEQKNGE